MNRKKVSGNLLVFLGALFWSLNAPLVKLLTLNSILVCGVRSLVAAIALLPFAVRKKLQWNRWMMLYTIFYGLLSFSIILALSLTDSSIAIGMQYTSIIWIWAATVFCGKKNGYRENVPIILVLVGVVIFMTGGSGGGNLKGNLIALSEGVFFMGMTLTSKRAGTENPLGLTAAANLLTAAAVFLCGRPDLEPLLQGSWQTWIILVLLGGVQVGCGYGFYNMGVQRTTPNQASMIALWEMILGPLWVALFLKQYPEKHVLVGFAVVVMGLFLNSYWKKKEEVKQSET